MFALGAAILVALGVVIGVVAAGDDEEEHTAGEALEASEIGDPTSGRELFVSQGCSMCHQFQGRGGTDGPALDFMTGRLAATDIAGMSGTIWNHLPAMEKAFLQEDIPFPTFGPGEMEDLIAYLHGGGPPPDVEEVHEEGEEEGNHESGEEEPK
ncbi:MAG TPA: c-type cytochrome [Solirubrobacterales bacterium]|nr:c-type cytochrome [Solirubrobacterales bacterium]